MKKFITPGKYFFNEELCSQILNLFGLLAISKKTGHEVVIFQEHAAEIFGYLVLQNFPSFPVKVISIQDLPSTERSVCTINVDPSRVIDERLLSLDKKQNHIVDGITNSYRYWWQYRNEFLAYLEFDEDTVLQARNMVFEIKKSFEIVVAMHVRRNGYALRGVHCELQPEYYLKAVKNLKPIKATVLIFSDDMEYANSMYGNEIADLSIHYSNGSTALVDLAAMTLCDHNIIANSTFSMLGALLSKFPKKIYYPQRFLRTMNEDNPFYSQTKNMNYTFFPDSWIAIDNEEQFFPDMNSVPIDFEYNVLKERLRVEEKIKNKPIY